jgi:hypothetical protein
MMTEEDHERLRLEVAALSTDLAKGLQALSLMVGANRDAVDVLQGWMQAVEKDDHMFTRLEKMEADLAKLKDVPSQVAVLEKIADGVVSGQGDFSQSAVKLLAARETEKVEPPVQSSQWKIYAALAVVAVPGLVALAMKLIEIWPGR